ncbi:peptidoglycan-binding protein [Microbispora sp. RL4-1S]|uniref:Peptidoglycan-binding protein n=1 Tax=Microbispora oryzae TaxID=2806554 RepID=A0A940WRZ1_9ACTN|nr:peptidoglycan-binding protein [Microbispora oryzae]MBP2708273.1 peptidoglycan-binding protein [Microbispora oryzae]
MRRGAVLAVVSALAVGGVAVVLVLSGGLALSSSGTPAPAAGTRPPATATVKRGDLVDHQTVSGTLGYAGERTVPNGVSGTLTWLPAEGAVIGRGGTLYKVDRRPVVLMYGTTPIYRTLQYGVSDGPDVLQLERNLKALGYGDGLTVDDHFSSITADRVLEWQDDKGLEETATVTAADVVFLRGKVRVKKVGGVTGDKARSGKPVLTVTGTTQVVRVDLDVADQQLARKGAKVTVELPGGASATGKITDVGTVAQLPSSSGQQADPQNATITIEIKLTDAKKAGGLDQAPVSVSLESERRENVLSVPVEALLALREGGYGVQVVQGETVRLVPVEIGIFAAGQVEVSGGGLTEGTKVGVPRS